MTTRLPSVNEIYERLTHIRHVLQQGRWPGYVNAGLFVNPDLTWFVVDNELSVVTKYKTTSIVVKEHTDSDLVDRAQDMLADIESQMRVPA